MLKYPVGFSAGKPVVCCRVTSEAKDYLPTWQFRLRLRMRLRDWNLSSPGLLFRSMLERVVVGDSLLPCLAGRYGTIEWSWALIWFAICSCWFASKTLLLRLGFVIVHCPTMIGSFLLVAYFSSLAIAVFHFGRKGKRNGLCKYQIFFIKSDQFL